MNMKHSRWQGPKRMPFAQFNEAKQSNPKTRYGLTSILPFHLASVSATARSFSSCALAMKSVKASASSGVGNAKTATVALRVCVGADGCCLEEEKDTTGENAVVVKDIVFEMAPSSTGRSQHAGENRLAENIIIDWLLFGVKASWKELSFSNEGVREAMERVMPINVDSFTLSYDRLMPGPA